MEGILRELEAAQDARQRLTVAEQALLLARADWADGPLLMRAFQGRLTEGERLWLTALSEPAKPGTPSPFSMPEAGGGDVAVPPKFPGPSAGGPPGDPRFLAYALLIHATLDRRARHYASATGRVQQSLTLFRSAGDQLGQARALHELAVLAHWQGLFKEAEPLFNRASQLAGAAQAAAEQTAVGGDLGRLYEDLGRDEDAAALYRNGHAVALRTGDRHGLAWALYNLACLAQKAKNFGEAERLYGECWPLLTELGLGHLQAAVWNQFGRMHQENRNEAQAETHYRSALAMFRQLGDNAAQAEVLYNLGALKRERNPAEALDLFRQSLATFGPAIDAFAAQVWFELGDLAQQQNQFDEAEQAYRRSYQLLEAGGFPPRDRPLAAQLLLCVGILEMRKRNLAEAVRLFKISVSQARELNAPAGEGRGWRWLAQALSGQPGQQYEAFACWMAAREVFGRAGLPEVEMVDRDLATFRGLVGAQPFAALQARWQAGD
jgi:tetratricopeptide (TPR) repeat protein